jgi:peptidoglycan/LPS O-acetylase OafA/YrhL
MRTQSPQILKTLTSSIVRRGMRLFIPSWTMIILVALAANAGIYKAAQAAADQGLMDHLENIPRQHDSLWGMYENVRSDIASMIRITDWGYIQPSIHPHLWTIVIEFRISMLLFLVHTATARLKSWARVAIAMYGFFWFANTKTPVGSQTALFFAGMILAEMDHAIITLRERRRTDVLPGMASRLAALVDPSRKLWRMLHFSLFILGLFFLSCPYNGSERTPIYRYLVALNPSWYNALEESYWLWTLGAMFLLISAVHSDDVRGVYTNAFSQYAGKISFALYLVHGPVLHCVEYSTLPLWASITQPLGGRDTQVGFALQWLMGAIVSLPTTVYFADMAYRLLDIPSVQLARWVEGWLEDPTWQDTPAIRAKD